MHARAEEGGGVRTRCGACWHRQTRQRTYRTAAAADFISACCRECVWECDAVSAIAKTKHRASRLTQAGIAPNAPMHRGARNTAITCSRDINRLLPDSQHARHAGRERPAIVWVTRKPAATCAVPESATVSSNDDEIVSLHSSAAGPAVAMRPRSRNIRNASLSSDTPHSSRHSFPTNTQRTGTVSRRQPTLIITVLVRCARCVRREGVPAAVWCVR